MFSLVSDSRFESRSDKCQIQICLYLHYLRKKYYIKEIHVSTLQHSACSYGINLSLVVPPRITPCTTVVFDSKEGLPLSCSADHHFIFLCLGQLMLKHLNSFAVFFFYIYLQWLVQFNSAVNKQIFPGCRSCTPLFTDVKVIQQKLQFNNSRRYKQNVTGLYKLQAKCSEGIGG